MKIAVLSFKSKSSKVIDQVLSHSLLDLGHTLTDQVLADVIIAVRDFSKVNYRYSDKKYILFQIEQQEMKPEAVNDFYAFNPDEIWGFDKYNEKEVYTPLGYHPCLRFEKFQIEESIDVGFFGWQHGRREVFWNDIKHKYKVLNTYYVNERACNILKARINLNLHFKKGAMFTEWGRICFFLANNQFFISERFYCPIEVPQFITVEEYDHMIGFYLKNPNLRIQQAENMTYEYMKNYDMRDILRERF